VNLVPAALRPPFPVAVRGDHRRGPLPVVAGAPNVAPGAGRPNGRSNDGGGGASLVLIIATRGISEGSTPLPYWDVQAGRQVDEKKLQQQQRRGLWASQAATATKQPVSSPTDTTNRPHAKITPPPTHTHLTSEGQTVLPLPPPPKLPPTLPLPTSLAREGDRGGVGSPHPRLGDRWIGDRDEMKRRSPPPPTPTADDRAASDTTRERPRS